MRSHPRIRNTKNQPSLLNHFLKPIVIVKREVNLCQIAPMTAKGYRIEESTMKIAIPAIPTGM